MVAMLACGLVLALGGLAGAATPPPSGPVLDAWKSMTTFHEDPSRIDRARDLLERDVARAPSLEALLLLAWAHLSWADYRAPDADAKLASYERGRDVAKRAIDMAPRSPEAHLWYAANLGRWAITKGKLRAAFLLSTLKQEIHTILEIDPDHVPGLALAGSFYLETPAMFGGDVPRAEGYLSKAVALDPHFTRPASSWPGALSSSAATPRRAPSSRGSSTSASPAIADWVIRHKPTPSGFSPRSAPGDGRAGGA